ncbi:MAG: methyltransferase domain-containing protein [Planctomycetota bacterium]
MAGEQDLDTDTIRREVERLAPWYYDFDLAGVRTSETPASDPTGHRTIRFPKVRGGFWAGRDVLDVACAEGAWTFGALDLGARVTSFDVREAHLEKARFVAKVRGYTEVEFGLGDCDTWPDQHPDRRFDHVTLCGIIYHVPDPPKTVERYCQVARRSVLVTSPTWGVDDTGYTWWEEDDVIGASRDYLPSQIPNSAGSR